MKYAFKKIKSGESVMEVDQGYVLFTPDGPLGPASTALVLPIMMFSVEGDLRDEFEHEANHGTYMSESGETDPGELVKVFDRHPEMEGEIAQAKPGMNLVEISMRMHIRNGGENFLQRRPSYTFEKIDTGEYIMRLDEGFVLFSPAGCLHPDPAAITSLALPDLAFRLEGDLRAEFAHVANTSYRTESGGTDTSELVAMYDRYPERQRAYKKAHPGVDFVQLTLMTHLNDGGSDFLKPQAGGS